jgi:hypothetical protein
MDDQSKEMPQLKNELPSEADELAVRDIRRMQEREHVVDGIADIVSHIEHAPPTMTEMAVPFSQRDHDLLLESIDHVSTDWTGQLALVRKNSEAVEALVLQRAAKVKADITALYLLGHAAMQEARRGEQINAKLAMELEKLAEQS